MAVRGGRAATALFGIVLGVRNAGEGHRVVQLMDQTLGQVGLWARHARGSKRRLAGVFEPFATVRATAAAHGELFSLHGAEVCTERAGIRAALCRIARAANLCTVVRHAWPLQQPAPDVFMGLQVALDHLHHGRVARAAGLYPRLAAAAGILPPTDGCSRCDTALPPMVAAHATPALLCPRCAPPAAALLPPTVVAALRGERLHDEAAADVVEQVVMRWFAAHVGRPLAPWGAVAPTPTPTTDDA